MRSRSVPANTPPERPHTATDPVVGATAPPYAGARAAVVYAVATLTLAWPALAGRFLVGPHSDQYRAGYAFRDFAAQSLRATHSFPLWNPYQFGGMPFVAALHGDIFYPTFLLRMLLPTDVAMTWGFIIHVFLAGFFSYLFLRRARFSFAGALVGGIAYMMSGHVATFVSPGHDGKLFVSALFPLLLLTILAWIRDGRRWAPGAMALIVGLDVLTPHPQLLQYSLLAAGAYALVLAIGLSRDDPAAGRSTAVIRLATAAAAVLVGLGIGAVQYLPVQQYVAWSPRAEGIGTYERATSYAKNPQEILNAYLPEFTGILDRYWGPNGIHLQSDFAGAVVLMLAGAGVAGFRSDRRSRQLWFWALAVIVALLWALGGHTPFYNIPYYLVPGTRFFRAPDSVFFVGTLGIAVFAARGAERALAGVVPRSYAVAWLVFAGAMALMGVTGMLTAFARSVAPEQTLELVDANSSAVAYGAVRELAFVVLAAGFLLGGRGRWTRFLRVAPLGYLAFLTAADLWAVDRQYWIFSPPAARLYQSSQAIDYLRRLPQPARVLPLPLAEGGSVADFAGAGLMVHRIEDVFGYHGNQLARYNTLVGIPQGGGAAGPDAFREVLGNPNVQRLTATQYVLSNSRGVPQLIPGAVQVAGPAVDDPSGNTDYAFRLPVRTEYAWVTPIVVKAGDDAVLSTVRDPRFDVARAALFDTSAAVAGAGPIRELPLPTGIDAHVDAYAPGHMQLTLSRPAPAGSALVVAENFYPGWRASVDGRPAVVGRAQYALIGVPLPAGGRQVRLDFASVPYERGKLITWMAIASGILALVVGWAMDRRRPVVA